MFLLKIFLVFQAIVAFCLVLIILIQPSEDPAFGSVRGGGFLKKRSAATFLSKMTWFLAFCFFALSIALAVLVNRHVNRSGVDALLQAPSTQGSTQAPALPLLPPVPGQQPGQPQQGQSPSQKKGVPPAQQTPHKAGDVRLPGVPRDGTPPSPSPSVRSSKEPEPVTKKPQKSQKPHSQPSKEPSQEHAHG